MMLLHIIKRRRIGSNTDHHAVLLYLQYAAYSARVSDHHKARASTKFFSSLNNTTQNNRGRWHQMSEYSTTPQLFVKNGQGESRSDEDTKEQSSINHSNMSSHLDQQQEKKQHKVRKGGTDELDSNDPFNWAPTNFQRSILVLIGFYKSKDQIPALIPGRQYIRYNNRLRLLQFSFLTSFFVMMYITWHILMNNYFMSDAGKRDRFNRQRFEEIQFRQAEIEKSRGNE